MNTLPQTQLPAAMRMCFFTERFFRPLVQVVGLIGNSAGLCGNAAQWNVWRRCASGPCWKLTRCRCRRAGAGITLDLATLPGIPVLAVVVLLSSAPVVPAQVPVPDDLNPGANSRVCAVAVQTDGKLLVGGYFTTLGGQARSYLGRLNVDGTLDTGFDPGPNGYVNSLAVQADGHILVVGSFTRLGGQTRNRIGRLSVDGTLDGGFNPAASGNVYSLAVQADGKILVGGYFGTLGGQARTNIGRLNADGTVDSGFSPGANGSVNSLAVQADGKILVGGLFGTLGGQARTNIGRLNADGTLDSGFDPGANGSVNSLAVQADGKILVGGFFGTLGGQARSYLGRLNADGTLDSGFNPGAVGQVDSLVVQVDGKILVGGFLAGLGGQTRKYLGRSNADGTVDSGFNPGANNNVFSLAIQADGKIVVGGIFTTIGGQARDRLGRLNNTAPATQSLTYDGTTSIWLRGGTSPEVWRAAFEYTTNGNDWSALGEGARIAGGWQRRGVTLPANGTLRVRGAVAGGYFNGSSWFVEAYNGFPALVFQPTNRTNHAGTVASFSVVAGGTEPLSYQWLKDGVPVADQGDISGATTGTLVLTNVYGADAGAYSVAVSNNSGSVTSVLATLTVNDPTIVGQPMDQTRDPGQSVSFAVSAVGTAPLGYQWRKDDLDLVGRNTASLVLTNFQASDSGIYRVVVSNAYGSVTSAVARLTVNLVTVDSGFNPVASSNVYSLAVQADGKVLVGGVFTTLGGQARSRIARLSADGTVDSGFNPGANGSVYSLALQTDRKVLICGAFTTLGGVARPYIGRLNADGMVDGGFNPGANGSVSALAVQADGKILVGGSFTTLGGQARTNIGRLNADGTVDSGFDPGASGAVMSLAVQADGRILVGGCFTTLGGQARNYLGRLNADGTVDSGFNPGASYYVWSLAMQADRKILVGGYFSTLGGLARPYLGRLNTDGTVDGGFNPGANGGVISLAVQADGRILVSGEFNMLGGQSRPFLGRLNADGTADSGFNPTASGIVNALTVQADGGILVGGGFTTLGGQACNRIGRLNNTALATQSLTYDNATVTWLRGGTSPEVWRTTFEYTTNGSDWSGLGEGVRIAGGWQRTGVTFPANGTLRARGAVAGDSFASGWFVEAYYGLPVLVSQPVNRTNDAGTTASFRVAAGGTELLSYQWLKNGVPVADQGNISGASTATLALAAVYGADAGGYSVVVSNGSGSVTSAVAGLAVNDPVITGQPASQTGDSGRSVSLAVSAVGTAPLGYQWRKDGLVLAGRNIATLVLTNVQGSDAGSYRVVVSNGYGSVTSAVAQLTVNLVTVDSGFDPGASSNVYSLAVQADGKVLVGGSFTMLGGQPRSSVGRLNADGTLDSGFNPGATGIVYSLAVQSDGKVLLGGSFTTLGGQARTNIGRLNVDGTVDSGFNPGASSRVYSLTVQADGKILVGGSFTTLGGQARTNLGRLNADGMVDTGFNPGASALVSSLAVQPDGKILVGGSFTTLGGHARTNLGRLNADGTVDTGFNPGANAWVACLAVQADGEVLVGGVFNRLGGQARTCIGRVKADGTADGGFNPGANNLVSSLAVQADGEILVGGNFTTLGGQARNFLGRLNADGTLDGGFNPGASSYVYSLAVQADGKILVGGNFTTLGGQPRAYLGRLNTTAPATQRLTYDGATVTWLRGGTGPEIWRTTFDWTGDGQNWTNLGAGIRIAGGWQLTNATVPPTATLRARGHTVGGYQNASGGFVESSLPLGTQPRPVILVGDGAFGVQSNQFAFNVSGVAGQIIVVEGSSNLVDWIPLQTNTVAGSPVPFAECAWSEYPRRFYRVRVQ